MNISMSSTIPSANVDNLSSLRNTIDSHHGQDTFIRIPIQSMKSDRRIKIYLGQIAERYDAVLKKSTQGFGLTLVDDIVLDNMKMLKVRSVYKNGPAAKTGVIQPGDILSAFNHIDILGVPPEEVIQMFKVIKDKESITLTVWKLSDTQPPYSFDPSFDIIHFYLQKCDSGFGFILGNCNEEHQVAKVNGEGDVTLLLQTNDKLLAIGQVSVENLTHDQVVNLLKKFPRNHYLQFTVRRDIPLLTRSISDDSYHVTDYSMNSSIYSKISKTLEPNFYSQLPGIGLSGPFNTPDFIPASHYLSLNRQKFPGKCDHTNCNSMSHPHPPTYSSPATSLTQEYTQPPDCIPDFFQLPGLPRTTNSSENIHVQINRSQTRGFGFRLMGGADEGCQVYIGAIVPGGPMDQCGLVNCGDILTEIEGQATQGKTHAEVVAILEDAARSPAGKLDFYVCKRGQFQESGCTTPKGDQDCRVVTLRRHAEEGFGFVIVSAVSPSEPCGIGRINAGGVADLSGDLRLGDRILAVNGHSLQGLHYKDVMQIIKDSDLEITLTVRNGNINSLKTIKYELPSPPESSDVRLDSPTNVSTHPSAQLPVSIMKSTSQFDTQYKYNPKQCNIPYDDEVDDLCKQIDDNNPIQKIITEVRKGKYGFGFSIRGGADFDNMALYILKVSDDIDSDIRAGDRIVEINHNSTDNMTHGAAVEEIQSGGDTVRLLLHRRL